MGWSINVDYKKTIFSFKKHIEEHLKLISNHEVDYFISTYKSEKQKQIIDDYKPIKSLFNVFTNGSKVDEYSKLKKDRMMESLLLAGDDYDFYFITRFDLMFKMPLSDLSVDYEKINLNCRMKPFYGENDVDDNLFFFPKSQLEHFKSAVQAHDSSRFMHDILTYMDETQVNFFLPEKVFSHEMSLYQINR